MRSSIVLIATIVASTWALQLPAATRPQLRAALSATERTQTWMQAAPAKPKTQTKSKTFTQGGDGGGRGKGGGAVETAKPITKRTVEECPMWKVLLLGDDEYEEDPVCEVLQAVMPNIENQRAAREHFDEAQAQGKSVLILVAEEIAEAYVEQLQRADPMVYAEIEEDK